MAYKKKSSFSKSSKFSSKFSKYKNTAKKMFTKSYKQETPYITFEKRVEKVIAKQIENKISVSSKFSDNLVNYSATDPIWFYANYNNFFNLSQGVDQGQRVGNQIKLKRWVIKGFITPDQNTPIGLVPTPYQVNGFQGYVRIMLMKRRDNAAITNLLPALLQNGNSSIAPYGTQFDRLYPINRDLYKVYWERTFKMGNAGPNPTIGSPTVANYYPLQPNNDFKMVETFGIDVCKYIGKDAKITYNDNSSTAVTPSFLNNITLVAYWSPFTGDLQPSTVNNKIWYKINMVSYFEYEDA